MMSPVIVTALTGPGHVAFVNVWMKRNRKHYINVMHNVVEPVRNHTKHTGMFL